MSDSARTLSGYIGEVASGSPTPGGGSVAAIVGALAAALGEMVVNLSAGEDQASQTHMTLRTAGQRLVALRAMLIDLAPADERAYADYRAAVAMPRGNAAEKAARAAALQSALNAATEVPIAVARAAGETAEILEDLARSGNPHLRSDAALGALLAEAALRGALLNVRGNAVLLKDKTLAAAYLANGDRIEEGGRAAADRAYRLATGGA